MYLILCLHSHQPVGNFDYIFEEAYNKAYKPFLDVFEKYPDVKINLHYSGCLLEWLQENHPDFLERIKNLIIEERVEILSGGFYEPILPIIPEADAKAQIEMMQGFLKAHFDVEPQGFWLAERIWEPSIPRIASSLKYTTIDDTHFLWSGIPIDSLSGYFLTEDQGNTLVIFPIDKNLRYFIPFRRPEEVIDYLKTKPDDACLTMGDDGEKFGLWPGTHKWVYSDGWLDRFFQLLEENKTWLKTGTFSEYLNNHSSKGKVYIPCVSYEEMTEWCLLTLSCERFHNVIEEAKRIGFYDKAREFLKGGYFRNFFIKYPDADHLHKRMVWTSSLIGENKEARKFLYKAQCNCGYWHGVFGGLYLPHLRKALYSNLIKAEDIAIKNDIVIEKDINNDLKNEIYIKKGNFNLIVEPYNGGIISEIDTGGKNLTDILSRRKEAYHSHLKECPIDNSSETPSIHDVQRDISHAKDFLFYDQYTHSFLQDHIFQEDVSLKNIREGSISWKFKAFEMPYSYQVKGYDVFLLWRDENISISKDIILHKDSLEFKYKTKGIIGKFGVEFCFSIFDDQEEEIIGKEIRLLNDIIIKSNKDVVFWKIPLYTVSQSEKCFDVTQQGIIVMATILLEKGSHFDINYNIKFRDD
ncbi:MAG: alpha-amylase/4-alpha-glucanotransferase domain-containing protein [bacterium]